MKYIAEIQNAHEVCLLGTADLDFWKSHLAAAALSPTNINGYAQLILTAVELKWLGVQFRELSIAVRLDPTAAAEQSMYLVAAFNTSRLFAWCERAFFQTPYQHARVTVQTKSPFFELRDNTTVTLAARCNATALTSPADETWTGAIFLPNTATRPTRKLFHARLSGPVESTRFDTTADQFVLLPSPAQPALQLLADSHFAPQEWRIRQRATHARSKTYAEKVA